GIRKFARNGLRGDHCTLPPRRLSVPNPNGTSHHRATTRQVDCFRSPPGQYSGPGVLGLTSVSLFDDSVGYGELPELTLLTGTREPEGCTLADAGKPNQKSRPKQSWRQSACRS